MRRDGLESAFREDSIEPSSGFTLRVMEAVRLAATEPAPLRPPWGRLALGVVSCVVLAAAGTQLTGEAEALVAPLASVARQIGPAALGVALALTLSRLPRLFVRP